MTKEQREPTLKDFDLMPFGEYQGTPMSDVPASYLLWLWEQQCRNLRVDNYIFNSMSVLRSECPDTIINRKS